MPLEAMCRVGGLTLPAATPWGTVSNPCEAGHEGAGLPVLNEPGTEAPAYRSVNGAGRGSVRLRVSKDSL